MAANSTPGQTLAARQWVKVQYRTPDNLNARVRLHQQFSTATQGWFDWVIDRLALPPTARILELGGGPGLLWHETRNRLGVGWQITFTDQSLGMLAQAAANLQGLTPFRFAAVDAQALPFAPASFDVVVANHMLYHVPDRATTFAEVRRVLAPGGRFFAATNDRTHLHEIEELAREFLRRAATFAPTDPTPAHALDDAQQEFQRLPARLASVNARFPFDVAQEELSAWFARVELHRYENRLVVTDADALADYLLSGITLELPPTAQAPLRQWLRQKLAAHGSITITPATGLFEAAA